MRQTLVTKEVEHRLRKYPLYSQDGKEQKEVVLRIFNPIGRATWHICEAEQRKDGDYLFYGFVNSELGEDCDEWGYFTLKELASARVNAFGYPMKLERAINWFNYKIDRNGHLVAI